MLSISQPKRGGVSADYYLRLSEEDYYAEGLVETGTWQGEGADALGLSGKVEAETLPHLINGFDAQGKTALVENAGHPRRQGFWDLTFSAPKSVSVLWAIAPEKMAKEILEAHQAAVREALSYLADKAVVTRRGKAGRTQEKAAPVVATFQHGSSRAMDPQIHTHALLLNLAVRKDGTTGSIHSKKVFKMKQVAGTLYQVQLLLELKERLGLSFQHEKHGFHVVGVPKTLCETFSKRSKAIRLFMDVRGWDTAAASKIAALETRPKKKHIEQDKLQSYWKEVAAAHGWDAQQAEALVKTVRKEQLLPSDFASAFRYGLSFLSRPKNQRTSFLNSLEQAAARPKATARSLIQFLKDERISRRTSRRWREVRWKKSALGVELRVQQKPFFPKAPKWNPVAKLSLPALRLLRKQNDKEWAAKPLWKQNLLLAELRVKEKQMFPDAPSWSPASQIKLPHLSLGKKSAESPQSTNSQKQNGTSHSQHSH